jgi:cytochrome c peroxidase
MMRRRPVHVVLAVVAVVAGGLAVFALAEPDAPARARGPHSLATALRGDARDRILRAVEAVDTDTPRSALVAEGRRLFRTTDTTVKPGESCASCHTDGGGANAAVGTIVHPLEQGDFRGARDPISLWGAGETSPYGWNGREESLAAFVAGTIRSHFAQGERQPPEKTARQAAAIVAYLRTLKPPASDFDRGTLSAAARRGEGLFVGQGGCVACHGGPLLTDNALHDTGVPLLNPADTDPGAAPTGPLKGAFNIPQLRDLRNTAPYMHNGSFQTLRDVVEFYDRRSKLSPLRLTQRQIDDLVAYLESL